MQPATKLCRRCNTTREIDAFSRLSAAKDGRHSYCKACKKAEHQAWYARNIEERRRKAREWNAANKERFNAYRNEWTREHKDHVLAKNREHYRAHKDMYDARSARRRQRIKRLVPWADMTAIRAIYAQAKALRSQGIAVHVGHIVPLRSPLVCGLHVQTNLQILPVFVNAAMSNRVWPDMP